MASMDDQAATRRAQGLPSLPPEVLQVVVGYLALPASEGDASAVQTLLRLSAVNTTCREWALEALYTVLILPRHVREFRKWYQRMRTASPPFPCAGYVRALFMAIDDVRARPPPAHAYAAAGNTAHHLLRWLGGRNAPPTALLWPHHHPSLAVAGRVTCTSPRRGASARIAIRARLAAGLGRRRGRPARPMGCAAAAEERAAAVATPGTARPRYAALAACRAGQCAG